MSIGRKESFGLPSYWGTLYRCNDCGAIFEKPKEWIEYHNVGGLRDGWYKEPMSGCPVCESGDFDEYREEDVDEE